MQKSDALTSVKNLTAESFSLSPSAIITLYEIDVADLGLDQDVITVGDVSNETNTIFRFHNSVSLTNSSIFWQGNEYIAAPIYARDFEFNLRGTTPTPKLSITVSDEYIPLLTIFKQRIYELNRDLTGAKVTRIRTFARFLDAANFPKGIPPQNFFPDRNAEFPRDVYFIDRKSAETKTYLEFELCPFYDVEGIKLPGRIINKYTCPFAYRGEGCCYEYARRKNDEIHQDAILPTLAAPVATNLDERFAVLLRGTVLVDKGEYQGAIYQKGECIFIEKNGIKYYFVSKVNNNDAAPPNDAYWYEDRCSKKLSGCKLRWQTPGNKILPFGGFPNLTRNQYS